MGRDAKRSIPRLAALLALALSASLPAAAARTAIQRHLVSLKLGDTLEMIRKVYPPKGDWPTYRDSLGIVHYTVEKGIAKRFPGDVLKMRLGLRHGRLVHLQLIYGPEASRKKPLSELVEDLSLAYGEPRRSGEAYWWSDGGTVARASNAELPVRSAGDDRNVEMLTSLEMMEHDVFRSR